jgi:hypothetical protein
MNFNLDYLYYGAKLFQSLRSIYNILLYLCTPYVPRIEVRNQYEIIITALRTFIQGYCMLLYELFIIKLKIIF